jgi:hypothetical protein
VDEGKECGRVEAKDEVRKRKEGGTEEEGRKERGEEDVEEGK